MQERPDRLLILGDTNSGLAAIHRRAASGIPVYHMEAGNRCYDDRVPEEVNRRVIDHSSTVLMPYTERSRLNLIREGFPGDRVYVTGNPMYEVLCHHEAGIAALDASSPHLGLSRGRVLSRDHASAGERRRADAAGIAGRSRCDVWPRSTDCR